MNNFQIILSSIFGLFILAGLVVFATSRTTSPSAYPSIVLWGTVSERDFNSVLSRFNERTTVGKIFVTYVEKRPEDFDVELIEALASGNGPDAVLMPHDLIVRYSDKVFPITYENYPLRDFRDTFIDAADIFLGPQGTLAIPFTIDPLVLYWNRDLFSTAELAKTPALWSEMGDYVRRLTKRDLARNVSQSTIALGEFKNINNAKEILSALLLQAGNDITGRNSSGIVRSLIGTGDVNDSKSSAVQALGYFTSYANPADSLYSWNRSLKNSRDLFATGELAMYLGMGSEVSTILEKNPNLNFDVAPIPQPKDVKIKATFARVNGFAVMKLSKDPFGTFKVLQILSGKEFLSAWTSKVSVAPARRDLISVRPTDPALDVVYSSAFIGRAWLDPNMAETDRIFQEMIETVTSGKSSVGNSIQTAHQEINALTKIY